MSSESPVEMLGRTPVFIGRRAILLDEQLRRQLIPYLTGHNTCTVHSRVGPG
jgi:hypothetical protein